MNEQPTKVTILRGFGSQNNFHILHDGNWKHVEHLGDLSYDEMLGTIARLLCPVMGDGTPIRQLGKPLHLEPPEQPSK